MYVCYFLCGCCIVFARVVCESTLHYLTCLRTGRGRTGIRADGGWDVSLNCSQTHAPKSTTFGVRIHTQTIYTFAPSARVRGRSVGKLHTRTACTRVFVVQLQYLQQTHTHTPTAHTHSERVHAHHNINKRRLRLWRRRRCRRSHSRTRQKRKHNKQMNGFGVRACASDCVCARVV